MFDNRNFGASDGEPRQEIDPWVQVRDYRHAITYAQTRPEVDPERIGIWGSSYSGGPVLVVGAIDRRVKCVVAQVPLVSGWENVRALVRADFIAGFQSMFAEDRAARFQGKQPSMVPVVAEDPLARSALPTPDSWSWLTTTGRERAPAWRNEVTLRTVEMLSEYEPGVYISRISPTPVCPGPPHPGRLRHRRVRTGPRTEAAGAARRWPLRRRRHRLVHRAPALTGGMLPRSGTSDVPERGRNES
ncbi:MAG: alpha/beta hydrolase [Acidimicrobiales bacterium]